MILTGLPLYPMCVGGFFIQQDKVIFFEEGGGGTDGRGLLRNPLATDGRHRSNGSSSFFFLFPFPFFLGPYGTVACQGPIPCR